MTRKRLQRDERRWLKRAGVGREFSGLGDLFCELHRAEQAPRCEGYSLQADSSWGAADAPPCAPGAVGTPGPVCEADGDVCAGVWWVSGGVSAGGARALGGD